MPKLAIEGFLCLTDLGMYCYSFRLSVYGKKQRRVNTLSLKFVDIEPSFLNLLPWEKGKDNGWIRMLPGLYPPTIMASLQPRRSSSRQDQLFFSSI